MRLNRLFGAFSLASMLLFGASVGCYNTSNDCAYFACEGTGGSTTTSTGAGGMAGGGGTGGGTPDGCVPADASGPVADGCGVFVSPDGSDANPGTKGKPLQTLTAAIEKSQSTGKRVYACAKPFTEAAVVSAEVTIYGGLDCDKSWAYVGGSTRTAWTAEADKVPVHVAAGVQLAMVDVNVTSVDASLPGGSSIALLAESAANVDLTRSDILAGSGAAGLPGTGFPGPATDGAKGNTGVDACNAAQTITPDPPVNPCDGVASAGGAGGVGLLASGGAGDSGTPLGTVNGGAGEGATVCTAGTAGQSGTEGESGVGASGLGLLDETGYTGVAGTAGKAGSPGQGGGGGGGAKGGSGAGKCSNAAKAAGASGGTGGSGGCGGGGGGGGSAGGSSIGIVSLAATFTFKTVKITASNGGAGGDGGTGQGGGLGGSAGNGGSVPVGSTLKFGCAGGKGGDGGNGGTGGGGEGGHSVGIAYLGTAPDTTEATLFTGQAGTGGNGDGVNDSTKGEKGTAKDVQPF